MSVTITVRIPRKLAEKMRKYREINWSEVVRRSIEEYLQRLEEAKLLETPAELIEALREAGVDPSGLRPLPPGEEEKLYREMVRREWQRLGFTTQAR